MNRNTHTTNLFGNLSLLNLPDKVVPKITSLLVTISAKFHAKLLKLSSPLRELHVYVTPGGLTQIVLTYLLILKSYMDDIQLI